MSSFGRALGDPRWLWTRFGYWRTVIPGSPPGDATAPLQSFTVQSTEGCLVNGWAAVVLADTCATSPNLLDCCAIADPKLFDLGDISSSRGLGPNK